MAEHPDEVVSLTLNGSCACGQEWETVAIQGQVARQVHDFLARTNPQQGPSYPPELRLQVMIL